MSSAARISNSGERGGGQEGVAGWLGGGGHDHGWRGAAEGVEVSDSRCDTEALLEAVLQGFQIYVRGGGVRRAWSGEGCDPTAPEVLQVHPTDKLQLFLI